jgi:hypothetical protein
MHACNLQCYIAHKYLTTYKVHLADSNSGLRLPPKKTDLEPNERELHFQQHQKGTKQKKKETFVLIFGRPNIEIHI